MKYKGFLLATAGGLAVAPGAQAADMLVKAPVAPASSWTGWYIGANVGAAWQNMSAAALYGTSDTNHVQGSSFIGGGQIGYNWQHGNSVFGVEGDISGLSKGPSYSEPFTNPKSVSTSTNWLSTIRGRMGLAVGDTLVYATGGLAIGGVHNLQRVCNGSDVHCTKSDTATKVGWTVGGGIEQMWSQHWTIGLEGLFVDLGKNTVSNPDPNAPAINNTVKNSTFRNQLVIGRVKANYRF